MSEHKPGSVAHARAYAAQRCVGLLWYDDDGAERDLGDLLASYVQHCLAELAETSDDWPDGKGPEYFRDIERCVICGGDNEEGGCQHVLAPPTERQAMPGLKRRHFRRARFHAEWVRAAADRPEMTKEKP